MPTFDFKKQALPHALAIIVFYLATVIYFYDAVFAKKMLVQSDSVQWQGAAHEINEYREKHNGAEPLWTNSMFGGMPAYTVSTGFSGDLVDYVERIFFINLPYPVSIVFACLVSYYIMLLCYGLNPVVAVLGSFAFTFFSFNFVSLEAGHNSKLRAMLFSPMLLAGLRLAYDRKFLLGFAVTALGLAFQVRSAHYQISYYMVFIVGFFLINELVHAIREKRIKGFMIASALCLVAAIIGTGANAGRLWTLAEYTPHSMRGKPELVVKEDPNAPANAEKPNKPKDGGLDRDYVFNWSHGKIESFALLIPNMRGGSSNEGVVKNGEVVKAIGKQYEELPYYWGDQPFTSGPVYAGAVVIFLCVLGLFLLDGRHKWWLLACMVLGTALAMGKFLPSLNYMMYDYFPGYNKFRTVTMAIFIAQIAFPLLAALTVQRLWSLEWSADVQKKLLYSVGIVGGIALLFFLVPTLAGNFTGPQDQEMLRDPRIIEAFQADRRSMLQGDAGRTLFLVLLSAGLAFLLIRQRKNQLAITAVLALIVAGDLWTVDRRYLSNKNFKKETPQSLISMSEADKRIKQDASIYRVLNLQGPFSETRTSNFHHSIGGYSPVKIRRYQDLIENDISQEIDMITRTLQSGAASMEFLKDAKVLNLLNTKYIKYGDEAAAVIPNPYNLGNAWFVSSVKATKSPNEELEAVRTIDPAREAVVDVEKFKLKAMNYTVDSTASIKLVSYEPNHLVYESDNSQPGLAVLSEVYYPVGWKATIDGQAAELVRLNYVIRGIEIPAGKHKIECKFEPDSYYVGNKVSLFSSLTVIFIFVGAVGFSLFQRIQKKS